MEGIIFGSFFILAAIAFVLNQVSLDLAKTKSGQFLAEATLSYVS